MGHALVVIDPWKKEIFKKHLDAGGWKYTEEKGPVQGTIAFRVEYRFVADLKPFIDAANKECKEARR